MAFTPKHQRGGKPLPPVTTAQHGTRTAYFYGCRCSKCVKADRDYQRIRKHAIKAGTWVGRTTTTTRRKRGRKLKAVPTAPTIATGTAPEIKEAKP